MILKVAKLDDNYKHPSGLNYRGYWGLSEITQSEDKKTTDEKIIAVDSDRDELIEQMETIMGLNSYYFTIACYVRKRMVWVIEVENLSRVANFLVESEKHRTKLNPQCEIIVSKDYVSCKNASVDLETFKADFPDDLKMIALSAKD